MRRLVIEYLKKLSCGISTAFLYPSRCEELILKLKFLKVNIIIKSKETLKEVKKSCIV